MQKFKGRIASLGDVISGFGSISDTVLSEEAFVDYITDNPAWQTITMEIDGEIKPIGYFNKFWLEEIDGVKYVFGEGFIYDEIEFEESILSKNFQLIDGKENT